MSYTIQNTERKTVFRISIFSLITHFSVEDSAFSSFWWSLLSAEESCETSGLEEDSDGFSVTLLVDVDDDDDGSLTSTNLSPETQGKSGGRSTPC